MSILNGILSDMPAKLEDGERKRRAYARTKAWREKNYWLYKCQAKRAIEKRRKAREIEKEAKRREAELAGEYLVVE